MSGTNQFLSFAIGTGANVLTPSAYAALTTLVAQGFQSGIAPSQQVNTPLRQATFVASAVAQIIADAGFNAMDDGDVNTFKTNLMSAMMPAGAILDFGGSSAPTGWLLCNGAAISRTTYSRLFAAIGTSFGVGDGSTTFNLPDSRNRVSIGAGSLYSLGNTGGSKDAIVVNHTHTATLSGSAATGGAHTHTYKTYGLGNNGLTGNGNTNSDWGYASTGNPPGTAQGDHSHSVSVSGTSDATGASGTNANLPPYLAFNTIIKY